jgi:uncharacterized protein
VVVRLLLVWVLQLWPWLHPGAAEHHGFYHPRPLTAAAPAHAEDVWFESADGTRLHGWFLAAPGGGRAPVVVHAHGNTGHVGGHVQHAAHLAEIGCHVLVFDYRGFGRSEKPRGLLRREDLVADTVAAVAYAAGREDVDPDRVVLFGYSLGGVLGLAAAAECEAVDAVVAFAPFSTWKDAAADHAGPPGRWLIRRGLDARDTVAGLGERPVLLVHGRRDRIVPFRHGEVIRAAGEAAGIRLEFVAVEAGNHFTIGTSPVVRERVHEFVRRELGLGGG